MIGIVIGCAFAGRLFLCLLLPSTTCTAFCSYSFADASGCGSCTASAADRLHCSYLYAASQDFAPQHLYSFSLID